MHRERPTTHNNEQTVFLYSLMAFFSFLYGIAIRFRLLAYREGLFKERSLPGFVVSIGNITCGGTGKTPATLMLAKWASDEGYRVAILSRGHGGKYRSKVHEVSDGKNIKSDSLLSGDEPLLLARELKGIPVILSKKRYLAGMYAHRKHGTNFFILDDGFQHLELKRDLDLVLIDAGSPFGNCRVLPAGPLREPVDQLQRADAFVITRAGDGDAAKRTSKILEERFPSIPTFSADHRPVKLIFPHQNEDQSPFFLKDKRILAFAGIAYPEAFRETLSKLGADPVYFKSFRDHYRFKREEIEDLILKAEKAGADYILTTEKDWMRIAPFAIVCPKMAYLCIEFRFLAGDKGLFRMIKDGMIKKR